MMYSKIPEGWTKCKVGEIVEVLTDYVANGSFAALKENVSYIESDGYAILLRLQDYSNNFKGDFIYINRDSYDFLNKSKVFPGDIVISNVGARCGLSFRAPKLNKPMSLAPNSILLRTNQNDDYIFQFLNSSIGQEKIDMIKGISAQPKFNKTDFKNIEIILPSLDEQEKISKILSTWDLAIDKQEQLIEKKKEYKKGLMQRLLSGEVRFKEFNNKWKVVSLGSVFDRVTQKNNVECTNVLTISAQNGLVNQEDYFNKSVSSKDLSGYYLLNKGDFAYNKSYSNGYPLGAIKRLNNYDQGVVSPLYICFRAKEKISTCFYEQYFESGFLNKEIFKIAQEGARNHGLLNVSVTEFFKDIKIAQPSLEEQNKIAEVLIEADKEIELLEKELEVLKLQKKGLMQRLLTGEVRVKF